MGEEDSGDKTEEPTPHKLREARKKGQIAKSKDFTAAIMLFVSFYNLKIWGTFLWSGMTELSKRAFDAIPLEFSAHVAGFYLQDIWDTVLFTLLPLFMVTFVVALVVEGMQTGFAVFITGPLTPNLTKLDPIEGFKKIFTLKQFVELLKSIFKMFIIVYLLYAAIREEVPLLLLSQQMTLWQVMGFTGHIVMKVITRVALVYFVLALLDYAYQRYEFFKSLRMSKKEIKDEYKRLEGDPTIKQRQREAQRQMSQGRQMGAVPGADVVVTNPIHIALAISFKPDHMEAPVIVAKGKRLVADAIRDIATHHDIPIIENPPLAREIYASTDVDSEIPEEYFTAVAEIFAFVYNLKKTKRRTTY